MKRKLFCVFVVSLLLFPAGLVAQVWSLDSCIRYAYANNLTILQSELNVELAGINRTTAFGGMLPSLNGQVSHGYNWGQRIDPFTNQFATERIRSNSMGLSTSVNLFSGLQQVNTLRQANVDIETGKWNYEKVRNDMALSVASAYLTILLNREFVVIAESNVENSTKQADRMRAMVNAGQLAEGNLNDVLAQLAADEASLVSARNNLDLSMLSLMQLLQLSPEQMRSFEIRVPDINDLEDLDMINDPAVAVEAALNNFPEIKGARTSVVSAELGEKIARGAHYPRLTASYSYGTGYSGASRVLSGSPDSLSFPIGTVIGSNQLVLSFPQALYTEDDYTVKPFNDQLQDNINQSLFFNLTIPIFNGFQADAGVKRAEISRLNAELQLKQAEQQLRQDVERAFADARAALASYNASLLSLDASQKAFDWAQLRYDQGLTNAADYTSARVRLDNARATVARTKYDYVFKVKILEFYQGKPIRIQ